MSSTTSRSRTRSSLGEVKSRVGPRRARRSRSGGRSHSHHRARAIGALARDDGAGGAVDAPCNRGVDGGARRGEIPARAGPSRPSSSRCRSCAAPPRDSHRCPQPGHQLARGDAPRREGEELTPRVGPALGRGGVVIEVSDNGVGNAPEDADRISIRSSRRRRTGRAPDSASQSLSGWSPSSAASVVEVAEYPTAERRSR